MIQNLLGKFEDVIFWLLPQMRIKSREDFRLWKEEENKLFPTSAIIYLFLCSALYLLAYYTIDLPSNKEPIDLYLRYRYGVALASLSGAFIVFFLSKNKPFLAKVIFYICCGNIVFWQSRSMIWRADVPHFYVFIFAVLGANFSRSSPLLSGLIYLSYLVLCLPAFATRPNEYRFIISLTIVGYVLLVSLRSKMITEIKAFISHLEVLKSQKEKIVAQVELYDSLKSFLPREIFQRFTKSVEGGKSTSAALRILLEPKRTIVACLYSDIRGFTKKVRDNLEYAKTSVFPSQEMAMENVEKSRGIPRPVGDLVFAYFDHPIPEANILLAVKAAFNIIEGVTIGN